jgi:uncharacterized protein (TIGR03437 family)
MDAANKLYTRLSLLLLIALTLSAPAWGFDGPQFSLSTNTINCVGTSCPPGFVTVNSTTTDVITYSVSAPDYSNDPGTNGRWLVVSPTGGGQTTPGQINFSLGSASGLTQGGHTAIVTLTATSPATGVNSVQITVNFNQGASGGSTLTSSINPINLFAAPGAFASSSPSITTNSASALTLTVNAVQTSCQNVAWLTATVSSNPISLGSSPATLFVQANASNLAPGVCTGRVDVSPSSGAILSIPVNFTIGNTSSGNLTATPNPLSLSFSTGGTLPSNILSMSSSSGITNVNASVNCSQGWLLVNNSTFATVAITNGLIVSASTAANSLSTGTYTCGVLLSDAGNSGTTYNVTVSLAVNGGSSSGLTVNPNPIVFNAPFNGAQQSALVTVTSQQGGSLNLSGNGCSWLTFSGLGTFITAGGSANISVFANPAGLASTTYSCSLTVTVGSQSISVPVTLNVGTGGTGGSTNVAPASVSLVYQATASPSFASHPILSITGPDGPWTTSINYASGSGWLALSSINGTLPANNTLTLGANISGLAQGSYSATLSITTAGGTANVTVNLSVVAGAVIYANPGTANFFYTTGSGAPSPQTVFLGNSDNSTVNATTAAADTWVTVQQSSGSSVFTVSVDPTGKAAGVYTSSVTVTESSAANSPYSFPVVLVVNGGGGTGGGGTLSFSPSPVAFSTSNATTQSQTLFVSASTPTTFQVNATTSSGGNWLTISTGSGTTNTSLTVTANPAGLANGTYNGTLTFNSNGNTQTVSVSFAVSGSSVGTGLTVTCQSSCGTTQPAMSFTAQTGGAVPAAGQLNVASASGTSGVTFNVQVTTDSGGNWLSTNVPNNTASTPFAVFVNVNQAALAGGTYTGKIAFTPQGGGTTVNVPVTLTVTAPPTVSAAPTALTFTYRAGDPAPANQTLNVTGGTSLPFSVTVSPTNAWLSATPATGTTPGTVTVSVNPTGLASGNYTGTVTVAGTGSATGSTIVTVILNVTAPLPTIARVVNAASYQGNSIAPGELITLFASDADHPIGPSTPVGLQLDSSGKVATTLGGVQVVINGFACPLTYVSATQVNAVVPYEVAPLVTASVLVKFQGQTSNGVPVNVVTTSPGIYTLNSSGTGPAAALNSNNTVNSPNNPATRGDVIVLYLTGEGQTSPPGVTGKVTVANPTPPYTPAPLLPIGITIGGQAASYLFAGQAPGIVSGVLQLNVTLPTSINAGDVPVVVSIGGNPSQNGVTVSVR